MAYVVQMSGFSSSQRCERTPVKCFGRFTTAAEQYGLVDGLRDDAEELRRNQPDLFFALRNIARALLHYLYFRPRGEYFVDRPFDDSLDQESWLPSRQPDVHADSYDLWIERQGVSYAQTIAGAMNLKLDADNPADREKLRRAVLDLVAGRKMPKPKGRG